MGDPACRRPNRQQDRVRHRERLAFFQLMPQLPTEAQAVVMRISNHRPKITGSHGFVAALFQLWWKHLG